MEKIDFENMQDLSEFKSKNLKGLVRLNSDEIDKKELNDFELTIKIEKDGTTNGEKA